MQGKRHDARLPEGRSSCRQCWAEGWADDALPTDAGISTRVFRWLQSWDAEGAWLATGGKLK